MDDHDDAVPFGELLGLARDEGLVALDVQVVQAPTEANGRTAVVQATARGANATFGAVGEASPRSAPDEWHPFLATLAELRAKARALRELSGLDHPVQEELAVPYATGTPDAPTTVRQSLPERPTATSTPSPRPHPRSTANGEDADNDDDQVPVFRTAAPPPATSQDEDTPYEGLTPDMIAKLRKLTISISALEGDDLSDDEADQKLDAFFTRVFKHSMNRASRVEGQRVVQRLSSELSQRRAATENE